MIKKPIAYIAVLTIVIKLAYLLFAYIGDTAEWHERKLSFVPSDYYEITKNHDSFWYQKISKDWYQKKNSKKDIGYSHKADFIQSEWAFFPLYPGITRGMRVCFGWSFEFSATVLSILFSALAFILLYLFLCFEFDAKTAWWTTLLVLIFPFHYYYSMMYTEAMFLFCLLWAFISIQRKSIVTLTISLAALILLRPNGMVLFIPVLFYIWHISGINPFSKALFQKSLLIQYSAFIPAIILLGIFLVYQKQMTGYYTAFNIAQAGWYRKLTLPVLSFFREGNLANQFNSIYSIIFIVIAVLSIKRFSLPINLLIWLGLLLPLCSGSVQSMPRFIALVFPLFIVISDKIRHLGLSTSIIIYVALFSLQLLTFNYWLTNHPFGF